jgi:hypothetical protein
MSYIRTRGLGTDLMAPTTATKTSSSSTSKCPEGEYWDTIDNVCVKPSTPTTTSTSPLRSLREQYGTKLVTTSTKMAPDDSTPITSRCPTGERWDTIDNVCVIDPNYKPPVTTTPSKDPVSTTEPESITEDGYSEPPPSEPTKSPIPESDGASAGGSQTINRSSPGGAGSPVPYDYPSSGGAGAPMPSLSPLDIPEYQPEQKAAAPIYKNPIVLIGGGALLAYLLLRKK